jgi:hypothetical protein
MDDITAIVLDAMEQAGISGLCRALSDQNSGSFLDHSVIAENRQNFGLFMGTRESQLQPNWR